MSGLLVFAKQEIPLPPSPSATHHYKHVLDAVRQPLHPSLATLAPRRRLHRGQRHFMAIQASRIRFTWACLTLDMSSQ